MRYIENLAQGHGIVWNVGERPVDGGTDMLFLVVAALPRALGLPLEATVRGMILASHAATLAVVYLAGRQVFSTHRAVSVLCTLPLLLGPGQTYLNSYFATPFFGLLAAVAAWRALRWAYAPSRREAYAFAITSLLLGLGRPDGVFLAGLLLVSLALLRGRQVKEVLVPFLLVWAVVGGSYFAWRWWYFSAPFPNPFYKKGGGQLHWDGFDSSVQWTRWQGGALFAAAVACFAVSLGKTWRGTLAALLPTVGFASIWVLLSSEMNYVGRFQYAGTVVLAVLWPAAAWGANRWCFEGAPRWNWALGRGLPLALFAAAMVAWPLTQLGPPIRHHLDGRQDVGHLLGEYADRGYTLVTTEAGLLPLYSRWRTIDAWGLNDAWIAHHGGLTWDYLSSTRPDVILVHYVENPQMLPLGSWDAMQELLSRYATTHGFILAAAFGETANDVHAYYVRSELPEARELVHRIRTRPYIWLGHGRQAKDLREEFGRALELVSESKP